MIEQYNNTVTVEPLENMDTTTNNDEVSNTMNSQSTNGYSQKISQGIGLLLIHLGILLLILGLGSNLLFFVLSTKLKYKEKFLFNYMFNTECHDDSCTKSSIETSSVKPVESAMVGGTLNGIRNYLETQNIAESCKDININFKKPELNFNNKSPGIKEWFTKANNDTDLWINDSLRALLYFLPYDNKAKCSLTILLGIIFYIIFVTLALTILPFIFFIKNMIDFFRIGSEFFVELGLLRICIGIFIYFIFNILFFLFNYFKSIFLVLKMLLYPLVIDGGISLLRILQHNMFIVKVITIILSIFYVSFLSVVVEQTTYIGVWIAYLLILLYTIKNLFT